MKRIIVLACALAITGFAANAESTKNTKEILQGIVGHKLVNSYSTTILNADGSMSGVWKKGGKKVKWSGVWQIKRGKYCRTLTEGFTGTRCQKLRGEIVNGRITMVEFLDPGKKSGNIYKVK